MNPYPHAFSPRRGVRRGFGQVACVPCAVCGSPRGAPWHQLAKPVAWFRPRPAIDPAFGVELEMFEGAA